MSRWSQCGERRQQHLGGRAMGPVESPSCQGKRREGKVRKERPLWSTLRSLQRFHYKTGSAQKFLTVNENEMKTPYIKILLQYHLHMCTLKICPTAGHTHNMKKIIYTHNVVFNFSISHIHSKDSFILRNINMYAGMILNIYNDHHRKMKSIYKFNS